MNLIAQQQFPNPTLDNPNNIDTAKLADFSSPENAVSDLYTYDCTLSLSVISGGMLSLELKQGNTIIAAIKGSDLGAIGGYTGWGTITLRVPIEELLGESVDISVELVVTHNSIASVEISHDGRFVGHSTTSGIGIGKGIGVCKAMMMPNHA